jgi:hypothetical protein
MELTWVGYRIALQVQREKADRKRLPTATQACELQLSQERRDVRTRHALACGNRYVAPAR